MAEVVGSPPGGGHPRTLFISDLHLDDARPAIVAQFERFLAEVVPGADALYILGDLFEYWVGDDGMALTLPSREIRALADAARRVPVHFMHGNRDFMIAQRFSEATGVKLIADPTVIDLYGMRAVLLHGDTLCTDDHAYQRFRAQVRDPAWQSAQLERPLAERVAIAEAMRRQSEAQKAGKSMDIMDVSPEAVARAFVDCDCEVMIHGHTHRPGCYVHRVGDRDRIRWVLNDWYEAGGYLEATPRGLTLLPA